VAEGATLVLVELYTLITLASVVDKVAVGMLAGVVLISVVVGLGAELTDEHP